jgi:hypothetical protein
MVKHVEQVSKDLMAIQKKEICVVCNRAETASFKSCLKRKGGDKNALSLVLR